MRLLLPPIDECPSLAAINMVLTRMCIYQSKIRQFFSGIAKGALLPNKEEWRQIEYLILITRPFFEFLNDLAIETDATTHLVLLMYRSLFQHIDGLIARLDLKTTPWKRGFMRALKVGRQILSSYYAKIQDMESQVYTVATVLAPAKKLSLFQSDEWNADAPDMFRLSLKSHVVPYQSSLSSAKIRGSSLSRLDTVLNHDTRDEVAEYLDEGLSSRFYDKTLLLIAT